MLIGVFFVARILMTIRTFSTDAESVDEVMFDRVNPGTGTSFTTRGKHTTDRLRGECLMWKSRRKMFLKNFAICYHGGPEVHIVFR